MKILCLLVLFSELTLGQDKIANDLQRIYRNYTVTGANKDISVLIELDQELRAIFKLPWDYDYNEIQGSYYKSKYDSIGIFFSDYWPGLHYRGKLLREAHKINPNSSFRNYTFYSTANCDEENCSMPNIDSVQAYLTQYPEGPFIFEIYRTLAHFHDDLYKEIRNVINGKEKNYKYDCYAPFISNVNLQGQLDSAQSLGVLYYEKAIKIKPSEKRLLKSLENLRNGTTRGWYFCSD